MTVMAAAAMAIVLIDGGGIGKTINKEDIGNGMTAGRKQCREQDGGW